MLTNVLVILALALPGLQEKPGEKSEPAAKDLFSKEQWYKDQEGKEQDFVGVVRKAEGAGKIGFGRFNPYRLEMKGDVREVYIGGKPQVLAEFVGKKVKITGKAVDIGVEGKRHREIWPARIDLVKDEKRSAAPGADRPIETVALADDPTKEQKVLARGFWRASAKQGGQAQQLVLRNGRDAATALGLPGDGKGQQLATEQIAQALRTKEIDWDKQMVVVVTAGVKPTGGYRVEVTALAVKNDALTVKWKLHSPGPDDIVTQAFTHPAETVLLNKFDGKVLSDPALKGGK